MVNKYFYYRQRDKATTTFSKKDRGVAVYKLALGIYFSRRSERDAREPGGLHTEVFFPPNSVKCERAEALLAVYCHSDAKGEAVYDSSTVFT